MDRLFFTKSCDALAVKDVIKFNLGDDRVAARVDQVTIGVTDYHYKLKITDGPLWIYGQTLQYSHTSLITRHDARLA